MKTDSAYLSEASRRMNSGKTEQQKRDEIKASKPLSMLDVIKRGAAK